MLKCAQRHPTRQLFALTPLHPKVYIMPLFSRPDDAALYYELHGFDDHPEHTTPIVLLNGMTQTTMSWKTLARRIKSTHPLITYDARGQGESKLGDADLTLAMHAADLKALLDELGIERAHLIGFSHGARVALAFAKDSPETLDHLVLCSATATSTAIARTIIRGWREILRHGGLEAMSWAALPSIIGERYLAQHEHLIKGIITASVSRNQPEGVAKLLDGMMSYPDLSELASHVNAPTLVVSGAHDVLVTHDGAKELARLCGGRHIAIEDVGHTIPIELVDTFKDLVLDFLKS